MAIEALKDQREEILRIASRHGASDVRVYGSAARGELRPESDVDFLVTLEKGRTLLDLSALRIELEEALGRPVDVTTEGAVYWLLRRRILKEARAL